MTLTGQLSGPSVLAIVPENHHLDACSAWRIWEPYAALQKAGYRADWGWRDNPKTAEYLDLYQMVVWPRLAYEKEHRIEGLRLINLLRKAGKALVYEVDDDLMSDDGFVPRGVSLHDATYERAKAIAEGHRWTLAQCDGATVTTPYLKALVERYTDKPVEVVPNAIDLDWYQGVQRPARRKSHPLTIGWFGGIRPDQDAEACGKAWRRVAKRYPHVRFRVAGYGLKSLLDAVPSSRLDKVPWVAAWEAPKSLANIDVGCCPLEDTPFNRNKSPIKCFEYAASGAAVVASPLLYGDVIEHGVDGYLAHTADEWEGYLSRLVESKDLRREVSTRLASKVKARHSLEVNLANWPRAYQNIWDDFQGRRIRQVITAPLKVTRREVYA